MTESMKECTGQTAEMVCMRIRGLAVQVTAGHLSKARIETARACLVRAINKMSDEEREKVCRTIGDAQLGIAFAA